MNRGTSSRKHESRAVEKDWRQFFHELEGPSKAVIGSVLELGFDPRSAGRD